MSEAKPSYTIRCDVCGFKGTANSEDSALVVAAQHAAGAHADTNSAHMVGKHLHIERS
jgi:hypothetical protein